MKRIYIAFLLLHLIGVGASAQTLAAAKKLYEQGAYEQAKPTFEKLVKQHPSNGNYRLWYGVCCLKTGEPEVAVKHIETAVKKRIPSGQLYLAQTYDALYRYEEAIETCEEYISELERRKRPTEEAEQLLSACRAHLRMLKGVEEVCVIDSFVVSKDSFLTAYKISPESGKLYMYDTYFGTTEKAGGTVYETELENRLYYSELQADSTYSILSSDKMLDKWSAGTPLPGSINEAANANYPYVQSDGITIYYAADGSESLGGYDIFVTRYNSNTNTYLTPENIGMPFNSPANDYMYVVDEFNNLGWFASDRNQPEGKVCIYVFIPNPSKQVYNFEGMEQEKLIRLAKLNSIRDTWTDEESVTAAQERLRASMNTVKTGSPKKKGDFSFILDDENTYHSLHDFSSPEARKLYQQYSDKAETYSEQCAKLEQLRTQYAAAPEQGKRSMTVAILDLEKHLLQQSRELEQMVIEIRRLEKEKLK